MSIITVVKNAALHIEDAIRSVLSQTYNNVEYIIIDGGSTDGTLDIIKRYQDYVDYWVSEPDEGIGDAWNKGVTISRGSIIGILNADDYYSEGTIDIVAHTISASELIVTYGTTKFIDENKNIVGSQSRRFLEHSIYRGFGFMHTTCFTTRATYDAVGLFDKQVKIAVDADFLFRCYKKNIKFTQLNNVTFMRTGGVSDKYSVKAYFEYLQLLKKYSFNTLLIILYALRFGIVHRIKAINKTFSRFVLYKKLGLQALFIVVKGYNLIYNWLPFFFAKNILLRFSGIKIGNNSYIHTKVKFFHLGNISIKNNSVINSGCYLDNRNKITIGSNVSIAHDTKIYTLGHDVNDPQFKHVGKEVTIDDYACLFSNVLVMPGVTIGEGAVVFPGSVVTKNVEPYTLVGGNPARPIGKRRRDFSYKLNYGFWFAL